MADLSISKKRKQNAKDQSYGCLMSNNLYYSECCEVLEELLEHFRDLDDKCNPREHTAL